MLMTALLLSVIAALAALLGGFTALRGRKRLELALGFTAGLILGLVAFDLLPEIFEIAEHEELDLVWPMIAFATGFLVFHIMEKFILIHHAQEKKYGPHQHPHVGVVGALAFAAHSFLDGLSIGLAFQLNSTVGTAVAIAVIGHRFADGFNTTNVVLYHQNKPRRAKQMLLIAASAPILGALSTLFFSVSETTLAIYLGFFAGFILYIGASDILPQAHSRRSSYGTIIATVAGTVAMFLVARLAQ
jgi:zinc and cadmium transporter